VYPLLSIKNENSSLKSGVSLFFLAYLESVRAKPIRDCVAPSLLCFYVGSGFVVVYLKRNSAKTRFKNLS